MASLRSKRILKLCGVNLPQPYPPVEVSDARERINQWLDCTEGIDDSSAITSIAPDIAIPSWFMQSTCEADRAEYSKEKNDVTEYSVEPESRQCNQVVLATNNIGALGLIADAYDSLTDDSEATMEVGHDTEDTTGSSKIPTAVLQDNRRTARKLNFSKEPRVSLEVNDEDILPSFFIEESSDSDVPRQSEEPTMSEGISAAATISSPFPAAVSTTSASAVSSAVSNTTPTTTKRKRRDGPRLSVRKRTLSRKEWRDQKAKTALNMGLEHETPRGVKRRARTLRPGCDGDCRICKTPKVALDVRQKVFDHFWSLANHEKQWDYISRHVKTSAPKKKFTLPEAGKQTIRQYFLRVEGKDIRVCKTMFLDTIDVGDCWVETALRKVEKGSNISPDKRGHHNNRPAKATVEMEEGVLEHIDSFPKVYSHYTRERSKREFLENGLSLQKMYRAYKTWTEERNMEKIASESMYRRLFNTRRNLSFFKPRKDQCLLCNKWKAAQATERPAMVSSYHKHLKNKNLVHNMKKKDKEETETNADLCVACFDLQKVLTIPRSETSVFFYRNKLSLYNFTVFDLHQKKGYCYMWNETVSGRGGNEIGSCLLSFIKTKSDEGFKEFRLYSDSPSGQNRNRFVFSTYLLASQRYKVKITHRFFEPGHSYSEVDSMHARIEKEATLKEFMVPDDWFQLVAEAKQNGEVYEVVHVGTDAAEVYGFQQMVKAQNWTTDVKKRKIAWSKVAEVSVDPEQVNTVNFRYELEGEISSIIVTWKVGKPLNLQEYNLSKAHLAPIPLKKKKIDDLRWLCQVGAIPSIHHPFYNNLLSSASVPECTTRRENEKSDADYSEVDE